LGQNFSMLGMGGMVTASDFPLFALPFTAGRGAGFDISAWCPGPLSGLKLALVRTDAAVQYLHGPAASVTALPLRTGARLGGITRAPESSILAIEGRRRQRYAEKIDFAANHVSTAGA